MRISFKNGEDKNPLHNTMHKHFCKVFFLFFLQQGPILFQSPKKHYQQYSKNPSTRFFMKATLILNALSHFCHSWWNAWTQFQKPFRPRKRFLQMYSNIKKENVFTTEILQILEILQERGMQIYLHKLCRKKKGR